MPAYPTPPAAPSTPSSWLGGVLTLIAGAAAGFFVYRGGYLDKPVEWVEGASGKAGKWLLKG